MSLFKSLTSKGFQLPKLGAPSPTQVKSVFMPTFWGTKNPDAVTQHAKAIAELAEPGFHFADNFFTWARNCSILEDEVFVTAWRDNAETDADQAIIWRRYILACTAYHCVQLDGDFVECGAYTGVGVKTVMDFLGGVTFPKDFWVYDLFEHEEWMLHHPMPDHGPDLEARVRAKFESYPQVGIFKGFISTKHRPKSPRSTRFSTGSSPAALSSSTITSGPCIAARSWRRIRGSRHVNTVCFRCRPDRA